MMTMMNMTTRTRAPFVLAAALALAAVVPATAQEKPPATRIAASVEVTISRFQGTKKISSQPFVMMPTAGGGNQGYASVRVGVDVPVGTTTTTRPAEGGREGTTTTQPSYRSVGTNMDCRVTPLTDGRFDVQISVTDSSIFSPDGDTRAAGRSADPQAFRTFQASNTLTMRDGQKMLLTTATDKVTGEILMIEVTFNLIK